MSLIFTLLETWNSPQKFLELGIFLFMYVPAVTNSRNAFYLQIFSAFCASSCGTRQGSFQKRFWKFYTEISINISDVNVIRKSSSLIYLLVGIFALKWLNLTLSKDSLKIFSHRYPKDHLSSSTDNLQRWWVLADISATRKLGNAEHSPLLRKSMKSVLCTL